MDLIQLYQKEVTEKDVTPFVMVISSAIAQGCLLSVMINAAAAISSENSDFRYLLMYLFLFVIFIYGKDYGLKKTAEIVSSIMETLRLRISDKIRKSELLVIEKMGNERIYTQLTHDTSQISESAIWIMNSFQSFIMVSICAIYILFVNQMAFMITIISFGFVLCLYFMFFRKSYDEDLEKTLQKEISAMEMLNQILLGFKELKLNQDMSNDHFSHYKSVLEETRQLKTNTGYKFVTNIMFSQIFYYSFFAIILFILPAISNANADVVMKVIATAMFIMSPFNMLVGSIPLYVKASKAIDNIYNLENELDIAMKSWPAPQDFALRKIDQFESIDLSDLHFSHRDRNNTAVFTLGPINLHLEKGELIFITGGNGSGKTTLMKLLCGLYYPDSGMIRLDQSLLEAATYPLYRDLFSVIMSDFYLFDRLYGIDEPDEMLVKTLLQKMQLDKKTILVNNQFTNIRLSTGQRKRLAMLIAILQDKPIYIFDEWAADQDTEFRIYYYEHLLKELKNKGKTIIAVSHDDRYYHVADRVIKMDYGQFIET